MRSEIIHHIDGNKRNNDIGNLKIMLSSDHSKHHARPKILIEYVCRNCSSKFLYRKDSRPHSFCSRRCIGLYGFGRRLKWRVAE